MHGRGDQQRGGLQRQSLRPLGRVNDFFTSLIARTRHTRSTEAVVAWWSESRCAKHFGDLVIPDGYGRWRTGTGTTAREVEWFLEFDTGTESLTKVGRKLAGYARPSPPGSPRRCWYGCPPPAVKPGPAPRWRGYTPTSTTLARCRWPPQRPTCSTPPPRIPAPVRRCGCR
ncbi:replication-relaxation family protein [Saccharothrix sp. AJ9571]|nr:replication-relaxation family protein [Saccharothrix sp. AJ9571]